MNTVCKVHEKVKKLQNENKQASISSMKTAGKRSRQSNHNECDNRKTKSRPLKFLYVVFRCRKML